MDARDVVRAYFLLLTNGVKGEIYNICSGKGISLKEVVDVIADEIGIQVTAETNPELIRPNDNMEIIGSPHKIESEFGWKRRYSFRQTIEDMIALAI